jgi:hypothetical protein
MVSSVLPQLESGGADTRVLRFAAREGRNSHQNERDRLSDQRCIIWGLGREGDPYTATEGAEGAAADVAVGGLLERRRRLHGPSALAARSGIWSGARLRPASLRRSAVVVEGDGESRVEELRDREGGNRVGPHPRLRYV